MKLKITTFFLVFTLLNCYAKDKNYFHYHNLINRAETNFFLHENADSAIYLYKKAFKNFDFVFAKDCIMAAQIAVYTKRNDDAILFIEKGFEEGIRLQDLQIVKILKNWITNIGVLNELKSNYLQLRKKYLNRLQIGLLKDISLAYFNWKLLGNFLPPKINGKEKQERENRFVENTLHSVHLIDSCLISNGFPGEKFIGIVQDDILNELGQPNGDVLILFKNLNIYDK